MENRCRGGFLMEDISKKFLEECKKEFCESYYQLKGRNIVLWGAGSYGEMMLRAFKDIGLFEDVVAIADNNDKRWN